MHRVIGNPAKKPRDVTGSQPPAAAPIGITGTLPLGAPASPSVRSSEPPEPHAVDPEEDLFGPNGVYRSEVPEDDIGLDQALFFGMDDQFLF